MLDAQTQQLLVAAMIALGAAGVIFAVIYPYISGERRKDKRVQVVSETQKSRRVSAAAASAGEAAANRKKNVADTLKEIETRQKAKERVTLRLQLERAGLDMTPRDFYIASMICGILSGAAIHFGTSSPPLMTLVAAFIGTAGLPRWFLSKLIKRYQYKFISELANAIDVVVRGVKSGLPLNECLQVISRESPEPLASEFKEVVEEQRMGVPLPDALERLCRRVPLAEVRFLTIVIAIQQQAGGNLSEALGNLSGVLRDRFRLQMKVKALSAEAKASAMVLASLPPGVMSMVYMTSPEYITPLFTTLPGKFMLAVGAGWMMCGILIMRKMINFKF
ncbi:MAG: type II secretion system F family protein [Hyphomicrobiaceae bacterium]|nr:type II secretion system F family protein [Hyphomicrobiaceae bacterium]